MYVEKDSFGQISIQEMSISDVEIVTNALARLVEQLPPVDQPRIRRLLIQLDKMLPLYDTTTNN